MVGVGFASDRSYSTNFQMNFVISFVTCSNNRTIERNNMKWKQYHAYDDDNTWLHSLMLLFSGYERNSVQYCSFTERCILHTRNSCGATLKNHQHETITSLSSPPPQFYILITMDFFLRVAFSLSPLLFFRSLHEAIGIRLITASRTTTKRNIPITS